MANGAFKSRLELDAEDTVRKVLPSDSFIVDSHLTPHAGADLLKIRIMPTRPLYDAERIARDAWSAASGRSPVPVEVVILNELLGHAEDVRWDSAREAVDEGDDVCADVGCDEAVG